MRALPKTLPRVTLRVEDDPAPAPHLAITVNEACRITALGRTSLYEAIASGRIEAVKVGTRTLVLMESLRAFLAGLPRVRRGEPTKTPSMPEADMPDNPFDGRGSGF